MSTPAIYSFKDSSQKGREDVHLVYACDGYPSGAADIIPDLAKVVTRIWNGDSVNLEDLRLPNIQEVARLESLEQSKFSTPFRYEIQMVSGKPVAVRALRHEPVIPDELEERLQSARAALQAVEKEMDAARNAPTYAEIGNGKLHAIRKLGRGYGDEG